jgi:hypothetical protein
MARAETVVEWAAQQPIPDQAALAQKLTIF